MKVDSLNELTVAFAEWRRGKRHVREAVPDRLLERARRGAEVHGLKEVVRAIGLERSRLFRNRHMSLVATANANGVEPVAYRTECLANHRDLAERPEHCLPWSYKQRLETSQVPDGPERGCGSARSRRCVGGTTSAWSPGRSR